MTNPSDQGPVAPRRTLSKPKQGSAQGEQSPKSSGNAPSNGANQGSKPSNGRPNAGAASASGSGTGTKPAPTAKPGKSAPVPGDGPTQPNQLPTYVPGGGSASSQGQGGTAAMASAPAGAPNKYATVDMPTEHHMPVVPPMAPTPTPDPKQQDKQREKAEKAAARTAAKAARKAEATKPRTVRRAKLRLVRVDPWSVTKAAFLLSIAFGVMCVVAVFLVFSIMSASGLWDSVNETIQDVVNQPANDAFDINEYVGMSRVMGITMLISAIDVVILTALATLGAFIYNMAASLLGGVEVTLAEDVR